MEFDGERVVLDYAGCSEELRARVAARGGTETDLRAEVDRTIARHLARYHFADGLLVRRPGPLSILDVACGTGYGAYILTGRGAAPHRSVVGVDLDAAALRYAAERFARPGLALAFRQGDCRDLPWSAATFDAIASFETLEHLDRADGARFVERLAALLRPGGLLILSTPQPSPRRANPFHLHEYEAAELGDLLGAHFAHYCLFEQGVVVSSAILPVAAVHAQPASANVRERVDRQRPLRPPPIVFAPPHGVAAPPAIRNHVAVCSHDPLPEEIAATLYCF